MEPKQTFSSYASAAGLVARAIQSFLPPDRVSTAEFAAANRYLFNQGGGYVGRWSHDEAPYLVDIMDALDDTEHTTVVVPGPGQCGKTATAENWMMKQVATDPANLLWYMQAQPALEAYVKRTINPMIENHPCLRDRRGPDRTDDSLKFKGFTGMALELLPATYANLTNKSAGRIIADEYDGYRIGSADGGYADPKTLLDVRRQTFGRESKLFALSHPDRAGGSHPRDWNAGIMTLYRDSDRRVWYWQCPHCHMWSSPNPGTPFQTALEYNADLAPEDVGATAYLACPHNGCVIADADRRRMNLTGRWVGIGQECDPETGEITGDLVKRDTAGFWIVGIMSPFLFGGIGGLAAALVKAQRELETTGVDASLREVTCKQLGYPYDMPKNLGSLDADTIAARADPLLLLGRVPAGVRFITCAVDVQANRFEILFRGWGVGRESWIVDFRVVRDVLPAIEDTAWDSLIETCATAEFPLADGTGRVMRVLGVGFDSGGEAGVTQQAMEAWRRARKRNRARTMGRISGRPAYRVLPLKGGSGRNGRPLQVVFPDSRTDRFSGVRGDVPVGLFATDWHKDALAAQLGNAMPGPGYIHFPAGLLAAKPPHPWFEQLVAERRRKDGRWEAISKRNEALDLMVMTGVVAHLFAPSAFDWSRPPPWARDWDQNAFVGPPSLPQPLAAPTALAPAPQYRAAPPRPPGPITRPTAPAAAAPGGRSFNERVAAAAASRTNGLQTREIRR